MKAVTAIAVVLALCTLVVGSAFLPCPFMSGRCPSSEPAGHCVLAVSEARIGTIKPRVEAAAPPAVLPECEPIIAASAAPVYFTPQPEDESGLFLLNRVFRI